MGASLLNLYWVVKYWGVKEMTVFDDEIQTMFKL
jgi:hypothetical protein